ncbi:DUF2283 domain-containing protein [Desulfofundulus thermosubterraneus]|uniref:Uncharacterized protein YuzE n=1 Tax=Desulfofundulus thermosubterraneus DSM 16057 TaxID=1121432 RepID=A0A1M6MQW9_9FIRM|nr:DUF2283 domain-containing protein [Desulfofundulus thermosubterraneus]SHJ85871.1 Uncharacterized protein YuzE [Desulfofundulus thermosubterraneus DSM 16057]
MKAYYDSEADILYLSREGVEEEVIELHPGINLELDKDGKLIGIELFNASKLFKDVIKPLEQRAAL